MSPPKKYRLHQVFVPRGIPTVTYVDRTVSPLLRKLRNVIGQGGIINVFGDSKSGKTVLCTSIAKHILGSENVGVINGRQIEAINDFWAGLRETFGVPAVAMESVGESKIKHRTGGTSGGLNIGIAKLQSGISNNDADEHYQSGAGVFPASVHTIIRKWYQDNWVVIVDDFHHVPPEIRQAIMFQAKSATDQNGRLILISIPPMSLADSDDATGEMDFRQSQCHAPLWNPDAEIRKIASQGFAALNIVVPPDVVDIFVSAAYRSPMLMQQYCFNLCDAKGIEETLDVQRVLDIDADFARGIIRSTAQDNAMPFQVYLKGKDGLNEYSLRNGRKVNTRVLALLAMAQLNINNRIRFDKLHRRAQNIMLDPQGIRQTDVTKAIKAITSEILLRKKNSVGHLREAEFEQMAKEEVMEPELGHNDTHAFIAHPSLKLFLRWHLWKEYIDFDVLGRAALPAEKHLLSAPLLSSTAAN